MLLSVKEEWSPESYVCQRALGNKTTDLQLLCHYLAISQALKS